MTNKDVYVILGTLVLVSLSVFLLCYKQHKVNEDFGRISQRLERTEKKLNALDAMLPSGK